MESKLGTIETHQKKGILDKHYYSVKYSKSGSYIFDNVESARIFAIMVQIAVKMGFKVKLYE